MTNNDYAKSNILQSIENIISYASYIEEPYDSFIRQEIEEMSACFKKEVEKKFEKLEANN